MTNRKHEILANQRRTLRSIRYLREEKSIEAMAKTVGMDAQKWRRLENMEQPLTIEEAWELADRYNFPSIDYIVGRK